MFISFHFFYYSIFTFIKTKKKNLIFFFFPKLDFVIQNIKKKKNHNRSNIYKLNFEKLKIINQIKQ